MKAFIVAKSENGAVVVHRPLEDRYYLLLDANKPIGPKTRNGNKNLLYSAIEKGNFYPLGRPEEYAPNGHVDDPQHIHHVKVPGGLSKEERDELWGRRKSVVDAEGYENWDPRKHIENIAKVRKNRNK